MLKNQRVHTGRKTNGVITIWNNTTWNRLFDTHLYLSNSISIAIFYISRNACGIIWNSTIWHIFNCQIVDSLQCFHIMWKAYYNLESLSYFIIDLGWPMLCHTYAYVCNQNETLIIVAESSNILEFFNKFRILKLLGQKFQHSWSYRKAIFRQRSLQSFVARGHNIWSYRTNKYTYLYGQLVIHTNHSGWRFQYSWHHREAICDQRSPQFKDNYRI